MATLVVGSVTVPVSSADEADEDVGGEETRMFDGSLRKTLRGTKRELKVTTTLMTESDASTLRTQLTTTSLPVTCSGDLLGASYSMFPKLTGYVPMRAGGVLRRRVSFTLREV